MLNLCEHYIEEKVQKATKYVAEAINEEKAGRIKDSQHLLQVAQRQLKSAVEEISRAERDVGLY